MAVSHTHCTPYLSATLFHIDKADTTLTGKLRSAIADTLRESEGHAGRTVTRKIATPFPKKLTASGLDISWFHYSERRNLTGTTSIEIGARSFSLGEDAF